MIEMMCCTESQREREREREERKRERVREWGDLPNRCIVLQTNYASLRTFTAFSSLHMKYPGLPLVCTSMVTSAKRVSGTHTYKVTGSYKDGRK